MNTSLVPHGPSGRSALNRSRSLLTTAVLVSLMMLVALASVNSRTVGANELYSNPTGSVSEGCSNGQYVFTIGLYNFGANDSTVFTVEVTIGEGATTTTVHPLAAGDLLLIDTVVPEAATGTFRVTNDDDATIDFVELATADCVADPGTQITLVCPTDGPSATVLYEWVNSSQTPASFVLHLPDGTTDQHDTAWSDHSKYIEVPVAESSYLQASIEVDGSTTSSLDQIVDCVPDDTTTTTPTPPTTSLPTTTAVVTAGTEPPLVLDATRVRVDEVVTAPDAEPSGPVGLASTGGESTLLGLIGAALLLAGLISWGAGRRGRDWSSGS